MYENSMDINEEYLNDKKDSSFIFNPSSIISKAKNSMNLKNF